MKPQVNCLPMCWESPTDNSQVNLKNDHFEGRRSKKKENFERKKKH